MAKRRRHLVSSTWPVFSVDHSVVGKPEGYVVLFTIEKNTRPSTGHDNDEYITDEVCEPYQVIKGFGELSAEASKIVATLNGLNAACR